MMGSTKPKALLLGKIEHATKSWSALSALAELVTSQAATRAEFLTECKSGRLDGVAVICDRAPSSLSTTGRYDKELIEALPRSLRFICHNGAGYDNIDIPSCTAKGIQVSHTPNVVNEATAETAMFLILAAARGFNNGIMAIRNGTWQGHVPPSPLGYSLRGKVLGILGLGGIGREVKERAEGFGMRVVYHNRARLGEETEGGAEYVGFDTLLACSDVLSLNIPLNENTRNRISTKEFEKMKHGIIIVNTARGGVVDEDALVSAIESGQVWSVGLDVYQQQPNIHPGLLVNPHVCLLPHMGTCTVEAKTAMEELNIANVRTALETSKLKTIVPEQAELVCDKQG